MKNSDIFVLNSRYEGLPHTVIEAMAYRCPVVATNIGGTREALEDAHTGVTVAPGNKQQLEKKLIFLLENERARSEMVVQAYENVKSKFTWENTLGQLERVLSATVR